MASKVKPLIGYHDISSGRRQAVNINDTLSDELALDCCVPQGSVSSPQLRPLYYTIYTLPLGGILRKHGLQYHFYVGDNKDYLSFRIKNVQENTTRILACLKDIRHWLLPNILRNNGVKTEFSVHGTPQQLAKLTDIFLDIDGVNICS